MLFTPEMRLNGSMENKNSKFFFALTLVLLGVLSRTAWHLGDNIELVTASTLLSSGYLGLGWATVVPFIIMFITDLIIGNTNIFLFTWSGYIAIGFLGYLSHLGNIKGYKKVFLASGLGIASSLWFFLWTNFGVWMLDSWGMYPKTINGLIESYIMGLPFFKANLLGNLVFVPAAFILREKIPFILKLVLPAKTNSYKRL